MSWRDVGKDYVIGFEIKGVINPVLHIVNKVCPCVVYVTSFKSLIPYQLTLLLDQPVGRLHEIGRDILRGVNIVLVYLVVGLVVYAWPHAFTSLIRFFLLNPFSAITQK